ncbi:hypothetical protein FOXG_19723 [Fusarium oxysporum f. sp. lycopersici 4287]|uniref:Uncharacterized protein n=1 Tax=Fusarium oxysporum f. sp. lycopersici (strain 4287 / CBS 123668 / FGSC 9935 / NRRL 34936) TaxID=426428 RepID=A0A0J9V1B0_FUSO4|nr:hypothetical protein FOXG_19303 [Fusarium oxysporum f. sp. lycopersici 4287]XP_018242691.1 hypothetical protein FOXG_19357 [Fusarium oxysporum f. sp. lycopersici 4287]XP_018244626.1 hypothetical protein FOXG_19723 [Fusarium oxysporum f. sp. lycopersici 4287]KNB04459.1 hypothetical protein FOXG_19303 [Fusarium oxysporum f. sp. lycopersici 4287]KNB04646.1 hypothetical protein FOXG_19357 [Fusarium oxysporum f. sp. lycopersici 4287]KNB06581.1 hypothetical protein FOXG_19723 [Fusarium oxysporum 
MAVTRSSRTPSSTSYSKKVKPCHVHNESPTNSPKSISIEPRPPRYPFHHPERRRPEQDVTFHPTGARPTRSSKKLPAIPTNSAVDLSQPDHIATGTQIVPSIASDRASPLVNTGPNVP